MSNVGSNWLKMAEVIVFMGVVVMIAMIDGWWEGKKMITDTF